MTKLINKIKVFLWVFTASEHCPICKKKLLRHGFEGVNERYTCKNKKCGFNEE